MSLDHCWWSLSLRMMMWWGVWNVSIMLLTVSWEKLYWWSQCWSRALAVWSMVARTPGSGACTGSRVSHTTDTDTHHSHLLSSTVTIQNITLSGAASSSRSSQSPASSVVHSLSTFYQPIYIWTTSIILRTKVSLTWWRCERHVSVVRWHTLHDTGY